jgi:hypothetical protein
MKKILLVGICLIFLSTNVFGTTIEYGEDLWEIKEIYGAGCGIYVGNERQWDWEKGTVGLEGSTPDQNLYVGWCATDSDETQYQNWCGTSVLTENFETVDTSPHGGDATGIFKHEVFISTTAPDGNNALLEGVSGADQNHHWGFAQGSLYRYDGTSFLSYDDAFLQRSSTIEGVVLLDESVWFVGRTPVLGADNNGDLFILDYNIVDGTYRERHLSSGGSSAGFSSAIKYDANVYLGHEYGDIYTSSGEIDDLNVMVNIGDSPVSTLEEYDGNLYALAQEEAELWTYEHSVDIWNLKHDFGDDLNAQGMAVFDGNLWIQIGDGVDVNVWTYNSTTNTFKLSHQQTFQSERYYPSRMTNFSGNIVGGAKYLSNKEENATEICCNEIDDDCDGLIDEGCSGCGDPISETPYASKIYYHFTFYVQPLLFPSDNEYIDVDLNHVIKFKVASSDQNNLFATIQECEEDGSCSAIVTDLNLVDIGLNPTGDANCVETDGTPFDENVQFNDPIHCYYLYETTGDDPCLDQNYYLDFKVSYEDDSYHAHNETDGNYYQKAEWATTTYCTSTSNCDYKASKYDASIRRKQTNPPAISVTWFLPSAFNPWELGRKNQLNFHYTWRDVFDYNGWNFPPNTTINKVETRLYVASSNCGGAEEHEIMQMNEIGANLGCRTTAPGGIGNCPKYEHMDDKTTYATKIGWSTAGWKPSSTTWYDLGSDAVDDFQSHLTWFSFGLKQKTETTNCKVTIHNFAKGGALSPQLRVTRYNQNVCVGVTAEERQIYVESWLENKIRKGEVHETQEGFWEILLVALGGLGGITLFLTRLI